MHILNNSPYFNKAEYKACVTHVSSTSVTLSFDPHWPNSVPSTKNESTLFLRAISVQIYFPKPAIFVAGIQN
jgi:hypothetical protein